MVYRSLIYDVWVAASVLQFLLVTVLVFRRTWKKFPVFTAYAAFNLFEAGVTFAVSKNGMLYFFTYWACQAVATILGLAVVYEVFNALFSTHAALRKIARLIFSRGVILLILLGLLVMASELSLINNFSINSFSGGMVLFSRVVMVVAEASRFVEMGLLVVLFLFSSAFGLHWKAHVFGIALGLGVFVAVDLVNVTLRTHLATGAPADILSMARGGAFCISVFLWTAYLYQPEHVVASDEVPRTAQLEQWNQAVMELINR